MARRHANTTHLVCRTGHWLCAIPVSMAEETMRPLPVNPLACAVGPVKGLAICRGEAIPVVSAAELLGGSPAVTGRFVTVRCGARRIALAVDSVLGLRNLEDGVAKGLPSLVQQAAIGAIGAIGVLDSELMAVFNSSRLIAEEDWEKLDAASREAS